MEKNNGLMVLIVALMVVVIGLGGFIVYDKVFKEEKVKVDNINESVEDKEKQKNENELSDEEIKYNIYSELLLVNTILNSKAEFAISIDDYMDIVGTDGFSGFLYNESTTNFLERIAPFIMKYIYRDNLVNIDMSSKIDESVTGAMVLNETQYKRLQEYFNVSLNRLTDKYTTDKKYINSPYYIGYVYGDGYGVNENRYEFHDFRKEGNNYKVNVSVYNNNICPTIDRKLLGTGEINVTWKNNHIYYNSFTMNSNITE